LGLYHVQEHIRRTIPRNTELKREIKKKYQAVEAATYDLDFSLQTVKSLHDLVTFKDIKEMLDKANELVNQLQRGVPVSPPRNLEAQIKSQPPTSPKQPALTPTTNTAPTATIPPIAQEATTSGLQSPSPAPSPRLVQTQDQPSATTETQDLSSSVTRSDEDIENAPNDDSNSGEQPDQSSEQPTEPEALTVTPKKKKAGGAKKKPKAAKNLTKSFDLQPKQF